MKHTIQECKHKLEGIRVVLKQADSLCVGSDSTERIQSAIQMVDELLREGDNNEK
jgi:histidine ammonia-lyase